MMGLCADIWFVPADKVGAIQSLRKGGDGNQGIRSLISLAVWDNRDIVQSIVILLHFVIFRAAWLVRRPRFSIVRAADIQF